MQDPRDPQTLNRYAYARNNPIRYTDPTGNFFVELFVAIIVGAALGAVVNVAVQAAMGNIRSWSDLGKSALVGAVAGGTMAGGGVVLGAIGITGGLALTVGEVAVGAGAGYLSGGVNNTLEGRNFNSGGLLNAAAGAGGVVAAKIAGPVIQKGIDQLSTKVLKPAVKMVQNALKKLPFNDRANSFAKQLQKAYNTIANEHGAIRIGRGSDGFPDGVSFSRDGLFEAQLQSSKGPITILAEASKAGQALNLDDIAIFPTNGGNLNLGTKEVLALKTQLASKVKDMGFKELKITGKRISGANPGKKINIKMDLGGN